MAGLITLVGSGLAIDYGVVKHRCRACGSDLDDFLTFEQYHEILYCLNCHEEVPIEDVAYHARCYQPLGSRSIRCSYLEYERKDWHQSRRKNPK